MKHVSETPVVAVDWTKCFGYEKLISEEVEHYSSIEVTEDLKLGGIAANQAWERWYRFLTALWRADFVGEIIEAARCFEAPRLLSLGCGYGGMEVDCARRLSQLGGPYEVLAVDLNENLFRGARQESARDGLRLEFLALDLNFVELKENAFDVIFAHASLHHLLNFEHLFSQVHRALRSEGRLIVLDIIGKTQVLFWPENIRFATDLVARMPERYRGDLAADPRVLFSSYLDGAEQQGMEGIRQEELEEQIGRYFRPLKMHKYNSFVRLICTHPTIALAFDLERTEDQAYLDSMFRLDLEQIAKGALRATEMFAVYEKKPSGELPSRELGGGTGSRKVSVLVTCDGSAEELRTCFASLLAQTHPDVEIILMPPTAGDEVLKLAHELAASHPRVRVLPVAEPGPSSWRRGLDSVTGEYIAVLSSRDTWYPVKLSAQLAFLEEHPAAGLTYAQAIVVDDRGRRTSRFGTDVAGEDLSRGPLERLIGGYELPRSTALFRRALWQEIATADDDMTEEDLWLRLAARSQVAFQDRPLGMLRAAAEAPSDDAHRQRRLAALQSLRRDARHLSHRLAERKVQALLDSRIEALGGTVPHRLLRRLTRLFPGRE